MGGALALGFARRMRLRHAACVLTLLSVGPVGAADTPVSEPEVGSTVLIKERVTGTLGTEARQLKTGFRVHRNELLQTGPSAQAEVKLDDNTKLALGPEAELRLDEYALGTGNDAKTISLKFLKGTFRFLTGSNSSESYKIETPSATIGVRGTVFDVYIEPGGDTFVLLHKGEVEVCSRARTCRPHRQVGRVVRATVPGIVSEPMKWTVGLVPGIGVTQAFPFVGKRLVIDPVKRLTPSAILDPGKVLGGGGKAINMPLKKLLPF
jgi:hypothetical protein